MDLDFIEGMQFDKGYLSPYFVTDPERQEAVLDDPYILFANSKIASVQDMLPVLEKVMQSGKPLLIIAEDVEGEALATLVVNKIRGTFNSVAVKAPGFGERRKAMLRRHGHPHRWSGHLRRGRPQARRHHARPARHGPQGRRHQGRDHDRRGRRRADDVNGRIAQIKREIEDTDSDWDREKLQERLAKLSGGVAVVKVGAATEVELKEKKHRIEDALSATRAAIEEGVVAGGGTALLRARAAVPRPPSTRSRVTRPPVPVSVYRALEAPARLIADNAGLEGAVIVQQIENETGTVGLNAATGEYRRPAQGRRHRPGQGDPRGAAERGVHRCSAAHHRGARGRQARSGLAPAGGMPGMGGMGGMM